MGRLAAGVCQEITDKAGIEWGLMDPEPEHCPLGWEGAAHELIPASTQLEFHTKHHQSPTAQGWKEMSFTVSSNPNFPMTL